MPSLAIAWEYLTGYAVATDPSSRERTEWPPHPARVFMAMAAAWFETASGPDAADLERSNHDAEGDALRWLESLQEPELWLPPGEADGERSPVTVYVPVNDKAGPSSATLQCAPALTRSRQGRTFPRYHVGEGSCVLHWSDAKGLDAHRDALARVCDKVTRIGHSSSLVRMWVADSQELDGLTGLERWRPGDDMATTHCRRIAQGLLDSLPHQTQIPRIERFAELIWQIDDAKRAVDEAKADGDSAAKKAARQDLRQAKQAYEETVGEKFNRSASPPPRLRPRIGRWTGYRRADSDEPKPDVEHSHFDTDLLILGHARGPSLPIVSTLAISRALRGVVMTHSGIQPVPPWVSGHDSDGSPCKDENGHLAFLPLPFVGREHADGHLLGMALGFPRNVERRERGRVFGPLLVDEHGQPKSVPLKLGTLGVWVLRKRDWSERRFALQPETWTAHPGGSTAWASVTPVVLDKFTKANRNDPRQRAAWEREVRAIVAEACLRIGLPAPIHIDVDTTSWHVGSPRAVTKRRQRGGAMPEHESAPLGDGFPDYQSKGSNAHRPQVHVFLQFAKPVLGPVLLCAGRYRGYGLLKPWKTPR